MKIQKQKNQKKKHRKWNNQNQTNQNGNISAQTHQNLTKLETQAHLNLKNKKI